VPLDIFLARKQLIQIEVFPGVLNMGWEVILPPGRVKLLLSPATQRGFLGEGQVPAALGSGKAGAAAQAIRVLAEWPPLARSPAARIGVAGELPQAVALGIVRGLGSNGLMRAPLAGCPGQ